MMYDKDILDKLQIACREREFTQIMEYEKLFHKLKSYVDKDIENVSITKSKEDVDRIEAYLKWLVNWMNEDLHSHAEYLLKKGVVMNTFDKTKGLPTQLEDMFTEERLHKGLEKLQEDVRKRSEYYARENSANE